MPLEAGPQFSKQFPDIFTAVGTYPAKERSNVECSNVLYIRGGSSRRCATVVVPQLEHTPKEHGMIESGGVDAGVEIAPPSSQCYGSQMRALSDTLRGLLKLRP